MLTHIIGIIILCMFHKMMTKTADSLIDLTVNGITNVASKTATFALDQSIKYVGNQIRERKLKYIEEQQKQKDEKQKEETIEDVMDDIEGEI